MSVNSISTTRTAKPSSGDLVSLVFSGRIEDAPTISRFTVRVPLVADVARRRRARPGDMLSVIFEAYKLGTTPVPSEAKTTENGDR